MQYAFTCPIQGCNLTMTVEAQSDEQALDMLVDKAKDHLAMAHSDMHKTDEQIRADIAPNMLKKQ